MSYMLDMLLDMHKEIESVKAKNKAESIAIKEEKELLKAVITKEIASDLRELKNYHNKLGIRKYMFDTGIKCIEPIATDLTIGFSINDDSISIEQCEVENNRWSRYRRGFMINDEYCIERWENVSDEYISFIYGLWDEIKHNIEEQLIDAYFKEQKNNIKNIENEKMENLNKLMMMKMALR